MNEHFSDFNIQSSCRTCLTKVNGTTQHGIFTTRDLQKKFTICTSLSVEADDGYPTSLCELCYTKIDDFYNFQQMCISSLKRFEEYITSVKKPSSFELANDTKNLPTQFVACSEAKTELEEVDHFSIEALKVKSEQKSSSEDEDEGEESKEDEPTIKCYISDEDDANNDNNGLKDTKDFPADPKRKTKIKFQCEICSLCFKKSETLERHLRQHQGLKPFPCDQCDKSYARRSRLKAHIWDHHEGKKVELKIPCTETGCDAIMTSKQTLRQHIKNIHWSNRPKEEYICEECGKSLTSLATLKNHLFLHTGQELPHECPQCQKRFTTKNKLKEHTNRHAGIRKHTCPDCGAKKATRTELKKHLLTHSKEKTLPCQFCDMMFNSIWNRNRHKRIVHEGVKNYPCSYCDKSFGKSDTRKHHEMTHTGEKPHECSVCQKKFIQYVALKKHEMIHQKPRRGKTKSMS